MYKRERRRQIGREAYDDDDDGNVEVRFLTILTLFVEVPFPRFPQPLIREYSNGFQAFNASSTST